MGLRFKIANFIMKDELRVNLALTLSNIDDATKHINRMSDLTVKESNIKDCSRYLLRIARNYIEEILHM